MYTTAERVRHALAPEIDGADPEATPDQGTSAAALSDQKLDEFIAIAQRRVDLFVGQRYTLPLQDPVDPVLGDLATAVAAYEATLAFYGSTDIQDEDPVIRRYRDARGILGQIATGLVTIQVPEVVTLDDPVVYNRDDVLVDHCGPEAVWYRFVRGGRPYGDY